MSITQFSSFIFLCFFAVSCACGQDSRNARLDVLKERIVQDVAEFEGKTLKPEFHDSVRQLTYCAYYMLALSMEPARAEALLDKAFSVQNMDQKSPDYGSFNWLYKSEKIRDENSIAFVMAPIGPILLGYGDRLSDGFKKRLEPHLRPAIEALRHRNARVSYTNIYLMQMTDIMLIGQVLKDDAIRDEGCTGLQRWIDYTAQNGVREYDSPTYTSTQLSMLLQAYRYASPPGLKSRLKGVLDLYYSDIAANTMPATGRLCGPHSRTYDFLRNHGPLESILFLEGLRREKPTRAILNDGTEAWLNDIEGGYRPSKEILDLAFLPERLVISRFGENPGDSRYNYLTNSFSIGSVSSCSGPQDVQICATLSSAKDLPDISVVADILDAPYGMVKKNQANGHQKPVHLKNAVCTAQENGFVLALLDLRQGLPRETVGSLATNVLIPLLADKIIAGGRTVDLKTNAKIPLKTGDTVVIREGSAAIAIRLFDTDGCFGKDAALLLQNDGRMFGAARITAYHYQGAPEKIQEQHVRCGVVMLAVSCKSEKDLSDFIERVERVGIKSSMNGQIWSASASDGNTRLDAAMNLNSGTPLYKKSNGHEIKTSILSVNGHDLTTLDISQSGSAEKR